MAHCNLCNKNTRCSCKWGGCPSCNSTNKQISFINDLLKFWVKADVIRSKMQEIRWYVWKIDAFTTYEYLTDVIGQEEFNEAIENYSPAKKVYTPKVKVSEVVDTTWRVNPKNKCVFKGNSPWDRCIYCNSIRKYMNGLECPKFKETPVTTGDENK